VALQRWIIMDALGLLLGSPAPGKVVTHDYGPGTAAAGP
jgi:hypothetical protein